MRGSPVPRVELRVEPESTFPAGVSVGADVEHLRITHSGGVNRAHGRVLRVLIVGSTANETNVRLAQAWWGLGLEVELVAASEARSLMRPLDVAIGRLDVLPTLDGVEPGLFDLLRLEHQGFVVLNRAGALLDCHDKLRTAHALEAAGVPHPRTTIVKSGTETASTLSPPVVVKPRFGSWGADVVRCETAHTLAAWLARASGRPWFRRHGALVQEYVPSTGVDLRIVVAAGAVVGAVERVASVGEWRTNTALGGTRRRVRPGTTACELALAAAEAVGTDLVGVDLLPCSDGTYTVIELNGAVEFTPEYGLGDRSVHAAIAEALGLVRHSEDGDGLVSEPEGEAVGSHFRDP